MWSTVYLYQGVHLRPASCVGLDWSWVCVHKFLVLRLALLCRFWSVDYSVGLGVPPETLTPSLPGESRLFPIRKDGRGIRSRALTIGFARMAPGPSTRRGRLAPPTPRIWLTAGALLAVACQGGGERPLETSAGLSLDPWGLAEPPTAAARASEPVIAQSAVGLIRTSGAVPRAPGG